MYILLIHVSTVITILHPDMYKLRISSEHILMIDNLRIFITSTNYKMQLKNWTSIFEQLGNEVDFNKIRVFRKLNYARAN